eukprot:5178917-Pyramimonas_sp.AAC.1
MWRAHGAMQSPDAPIRRRKHGYIRTMDQWEPGGALTVSLLCAVCGFGDGNEKKCTDRALWE